MNQKMNVACNFNCLMEIEVLANVTGRDMHCKSGDISETMQDRDVAATGH